MVATVPIFCPDTDACMGSRSYVAKRFATRTEAEEYSNQLEEATFGDASCKVEMKPYKEGEEEIIYPRYSALEIYNDSRCEYDPFDEGF